MKYQSLYSGLFVAVFGIVAEGGVVSAKPFGITGVSGINGTTCNKCHVGNTLANVAISGSQLVKPDEIKSFVLTLTTSDNALPRSGLNVAANGGTLISNLSESLTVVKSGELTHKSPKKFTEPSGTWVFDWKAPSTPGQYTIYAAGIRGDGEGKTGDQHGSTTLTITVKNEDEGTTTVPNWGSWPSVTPDASTPASQYQWVNAIGNDAGASATEDTFPVSTDAGIANGNDTSIEGPNLDDTDNENRNSNAVLDDRGFGCSIGGHSGSTLLFAIGLLLLMRLPRRRSHK